MNSTPFQYDINQQADWAIERLDAQISEREAQIEVRKAEIKAREANRSWLEVWVEKAFIVAAYVVGIPIAVVTVVGMAATLIPALLVGALALPWLVGTPDPDQRRNRPEAPKPPREWRAGRDYG